MTLLIFFPNDHLLAWAFYVPGRQATAVVESVARGEWPFPAAWRLALEDQFIVPDTLRLLARAHGASVVIYPDPPLVERAPGRWVPLNPAQTEVLTLIAGGLTTGQIARTLRVRRRWVMYRVAEVKRRLGAATRAEAVALRRGSRTAPEE